MVKGDTQVILPRKGVLELARLLMEEEAEIAIVIGSNHIRAMTRRLYLYLQAGRWQVP